MSYHPLQDLKNKSLGKMLPEGSFKPRIYHRKGSSNKTPRYLIKCGCCEEKLEIYYDDDTLEINGVIASLESWQLTTLKCLLISPKTTKPPGGGLSP